MPSSWATVTVTELLPTPAAVAVIDDPPSDTAITLPDVLTVAILGFEEDQVNVAATAVPPAFRAVAESCVDPPKETRVTASGATSTDATVVSAGAVDSSEPHASASPAARMAGPVARRLANSLFRFLNVSDGLGQE